MKLYQADLSPFASRVRIQLYAKQLDVPFADPPGGLSSDEYKKINPTGRVPALEVDGTVIPESTVIFEYLEDRFPEPSLQPAEALEMFEKVAAADPGFRDVTERIQELR